MKKVFFAIGAAFLLSCNSNPSATGDKVIMQQEKETNALEWQNGPSDTSTAASTASPVSTTTSKDSSAQQK